MKKISTVMCLLLTLGCSIESLAQFNQGRWLAGGSVALAMSTVKSSDGTTTVTEFKSTSLSFSPSVGYFVMDFLAVGAQLGASTSKSKGVSTDYTSTSSSLSIGPFARYYLPSSIFFEGNVGFGTSHFLYESGTFNSESNMGLLNWGLAAGYAYFFNDFVALEPMIGYQNMRNKVKDADDMDITGRISLSAALTVYLGERK